MAPVLPSWPPPAWDTHILMPGISQSPAKPQGWVTRGWANGHHMVDLGRGPTLSLSHTVWNASLLTRLLLECGWGTSGWGVELQRVKEMTLSQIEGWPWLGETTVDWGSRGMEL